MILETVTWTIGFQYILKVLAKFLPATPAEYFYCKSFGLTMFISPRLIHSVS